MSAAETVRFGPAGSVRGAIAAPPDKSISHRAAILGAFGEGFTTIRRYLDSADTRSTLAAMRALGAGVEVSESGSRGSERGGIEVRLEGFGLRGASATGQPIDVGNAGTLIRLVSGLLAGQPAGEFTLDGDESIRARPMGRIAAPLRRMGAEVETSERGRPPLRIAGSALRGVDYSSPVASAQVKSCVLLAGLLADGPTTVREPALSRDHTERMLAASGARLSTEARAPVLPTDPAKGSVTVRPASGISLPDLTVPGDMSSAAFHLAAGLLVPRGDVRVDGVGLNPTRIGLIGILNRMGAIVEIVEGGFEAGEPTGSIRARHGDLRGTRVQPAEVALAIDELPLVGLLGCFAEGETHVLGATELRHKESDRIEATVEALNALGGSAEARPDGFVVKGTGGLRGGTIDARGDHRLAMLGAVAGLASREGVVVEGFGAVGVSYPGFEGDLRSLLAA